MIGEPIVSREMYMKYLLITAEAIPNFSPINEHTPNTCHSI
jgi:hypothetical protein